MDRNQKIQEMQSIEQNLQNLLLQKQSFQMELSETEAALKEIENSGDEVYKVIGQLMIRGDREKIKKELEDKKNTLNTRITTIEKQEETLSKKLEEARSELSHSSEKSA